MFSALLSFQLLATLAEPRTPAELERQIDAGNLDSVQAELERTQLPEPTRWALHGRLALARNLPRRAAGYFAQAVQAQPDHLPLRLLWAHALLRAGQAADAERVLLARPGIDATDPAVALVLSAAADAQRDPALAYKRLGAAAGQHPERADLRQQLMLLCVREGLLQPAQRWAASMTPAQLGADVALATLRELRGRAHALPFARQLAAGFPDRAAIQTELGWVASRAGRTREAADAFARASYLGDPAGHFAAADHARARGAYREALRWNARVPDPGRRAQQRFDILFESGAMAQAIAAAGVLQAEHGLSSRRRYNLAYALYAQGRFNAASTHARQLLSTEHDARARRLLRAMGR